MKIEMTDPRRLEASAYNPRTISAEELAKLRRSIRKFGLVEPILVQMPGNRIIGGHQRVKAAIAEKLRTVPVHRLRISDDKAKALNLALNRVHGEWDDEKLAALLSELDQAARADSGFDEDEIEKLLQGALEGSAAEKVDPAPAPRVVFYLLAIPSEREPDAKHHLDALATIAELNIRSSRAQEDNLRSENA